MHPRRLHGDASGASLTSINTPPDSEQAKLPGACCYGPTANSFKLTPMTTALCSDLLHMDDAARLRIGGAWTLANYSHLQQQISALQLPLAANQTVDVQALTALDTAGAALLIKLLGATRIQQLITSRRPTARRPPRPAAHCQQRPGRIRTQPPATRAPAAPMQLLAQLGEQVAIFGRALLALARLYRSDPRHPGAHAAAAVALAGHGTGGADAANRPQRRTHSRLADLSGGCRGGVSRRHGAQPFRRQHLHGDAGGVLLPA